MEVVSRGAPGPACRHPYLQALRAAHVPVAQVIAEAETLGFAPADLLDLADHLLGLEPGGMSKASVFLLLATLRAWEPFLAQAMAFGVELFEPILYDLCWDLDPLSSSLSDEDWASMCETALERLGYPGGSRLTVAGDLARTSALPWLDQDRALVLEELDLDRFRSRARAWSQLRVTLLSLRDGAGPLRLGQASSCLPRDPGYGRSIRLFRVARVRALEDLHQVTSLVAVDCPDLEALEGAPPFLVLRNCPGFRRLPPQRRSCLLHLEDLPQLRSLGSCDDAEEPYEEAKPTAYQTVILSRCAALRNLPWRFQVAGHLILRAMGPIHRWPAEFQVGGDFRLRDCAAIEELPVLEVRGNLRVEGASGLRRLAPGTVVGRHLDLRACSLLEGLPRGVKVGGAIFLPEHLHRAGAVFEAEEPLLDEPVDRYPVLRTVLLGMGFPALTRAEERFKVRERAEAALRDLRRELRRNPRLENDLLWTASEVWRDLAEEAWAQDHPYFADDNEADEDLPLAWFRGLLLTA